ncbi:unnamed protein product [Medioppia subpectinata]|uniref:ABC transporter domain-containing protein n=2 Tax=Medioppia subpectinata TaxID=1979941 RepID=A0A7R9Q8L5_9ACAR|nr:unnamed protein product [Medioppia subpectinata]CAG2115476.1 unnamed protein product [Medioppia subpectinata]
MDEADVLADRKAIVSNGRLRCVGTSLFLKKRFGIGYHLAVDIRPGTDVDTVNHLIVANISNARLERFTASEVFYILPPTETQLFPRLFDALERNIAEENNFIQSFGISMTSLEEVFLKLGEEIHDESQNTHKQYTTDDSVRPSLRLESLISDESDLKPSFWQSFKAFLYLRLLIFIRNPMHAIPIIVLPVIIIIISYFLVRTSSVKDLSPTPILLKPSVYTTRALLYKNATNIDVKKFTELVDRLGATARSVDNFSMKSVADSYMAAKIDTLDKPMELLFNDTFTHSLPILINLMSNVLYYTQGSAKPIQSPINTYNHPFPQTDEESVLYSFDGKVFTYCILMAIMLGTIPPTISVEVVEDRETKIKNLLRVCGLTLRQYWFTTLVCHMIMFLISVLLILIITVWIVKIEFLQDSEAVGCVFILFILFIPSSLITCYVWSHLFNKKETARGILPLLCYLPGMIMVMVVALVSPNNADTGKLLHYVFCFLTPFYVPQGALLYVAITSNLIKISSVAGIPRVSFFDWNQNIVICFIALLFHLILYSILLTIVDKLKSGESMSSALGFDRRPAHTMSMPSELEDEDVRHERVEVQKFMTDSHPNKQPIVVLNELHKKYSTPNPYACLKKDKKRAKTAVQNMSLLLESGHVFGLLGPNGAGKTTTMKIMICEEIQTEGTVLISGHRVKASDSHVFKLIGYCPQHDALWKEITVREHMELIAAIRGIPRDRIKRICDNYIEDLRISEHSAKKTQELSGGTKRKLCYLMALLGRSSLVLLDEPSTGMDPKGMSKSKSKRFLWQTILSAFERNTNRSAVLTTHSMEEADALCTRLAIMIKGVMRCIGSVQHLKNKYGAGYVLEIKWTQTPDNAGFGPKLKHTIESFFANNVSVKEEYNNRLAFDIPQQSIQSLSKIFSFLEDLRQTMADIEEYSFSQKTIEQIFIDFAKQQEFDQ